MELRFHKIHFDPMRCPPLPADAGSRSGAYRALAGQETVRKFLYQ